MKTVKIFLFSLILLTVLIGIACNTGTNNNAKIQIIGTTDVHGSIFSYDFINNEERSASLGSLTSYLDSLKKNSDKNLVLLDNGDILQGQPSVYYSNYIDTTGHHIVSRVYNFMNFDAVTVGNHDIEPGHAVYDKLRSEFDFPWLAANAIDKKTDQPYFEPYTVINRSGIKVAVLGMITPHIPNWLPEKVYRGIKFEDIVESSKKWVNHIKTEENPDIMVGLFHSGYGNPETARMEENAVQDVARKVEGFNIIIYGHDHQPKNVKLENPAGDTVLLLNPGANAKKAAIADISFSKNKDGWEIESIDGEFLELSKYEPTTAFQKEFKSSEEKIKQYVGKEITYLPETLSSAGSLFGPSKWMQLIHEVQMDYTGADLSFSAPLSIYNAMEKGEITTGELFKFYRCRNLLYTIRLTGQEIHDYLEYSYRDWYNQMNEPEDHLLKFRKDSNNKPLYSQEYGHYLLEGTYYNFDSGYGIDYTVDVSRPAGDRVEIKSFTDGRPFMYDEFYKVAINSYRANGGGGHLTKGAGLDKEEINTRILNVRDNDIRYLIEEKIEEQDTLKIEVKNNWRVLPVSWWKTTKSRDSLLLYNSN
jgi:2',3'-cyclic-nucleotide 2'-phosphodiesterase/3'-nucleotidase